MLINRAHRILLDPTNKQATYFAKACGISRFAYNWALGEWERQYEACKLDPKLPKPNEQALRKQLNSIKRESFPWMLEVTKCAPQQAIKDLGAAYQSFFQGIRKFPKFKKRGIAKDSFYLDNDLFRVDGKKIRVPKLGWVRMKESSRWPEGKLLSCTISRSGTKWYASLNYEIEIPDPSDHQGPAVGVDLGLMNLAILSDGTIYPNPRHGSKGAKKLRRLNKELHRRKKGSKNRAKTKAKLATLHERMKSQRQDSLHKLSKDITYHYGLIGLESLNLKGMVKWNLAKSLNDASLGELARQITYKAIPLGGKVVKVDRFFPSSKLCSTCKVKNQDLQLSQRAWDCSNCNAHHDRDVNAAINIKNEALRVLAGSSSVTACGEESSGKGTFGSGVKLASTKQEPNIASNSG